MLYAGPLDGLEFDTLSPDVTSFVLPVKDQPAAVYEISGAWSLHFGKLTAIHEHFPGKPPKNLQAA